MLHPRISLVSDSYTIRKGLEKVYMTYNIMKVKMYNMMIDTSIYVIGLPF